MMCCMSSVSNDIIQDGRGQPNPYRFWERMLRVLWVFTYYCLYRPVPRIFNGWHCMLLRLFGANIGRGCIIYPSAEIYFPWRLHLSDYCVIADRVKLYNLCDIWIGRHSVISQHSHLCAGTHDYTQTHMPLLRLPITIQDGVWICTDAFIGPGVTIGNNTVVGARSVVMTDLPPSVVCAGNPAKILKERHLHKS